MKNSWLAAFALSSLVGCVEPPVPVGPAAEAPTDAVEITMDAPAMNAPAMNAETNGE